MKSITVILGRAAGVFALLAATGAASAQELTVVSFGGTYQDAQRAIYFEPFAAATGVRIREESWDGGYGVIAAKLEMPPADWDVVNVETAELLLGCADGMYEQLDWAALGGKEKYLEQAASDCGVGTNVWSTGLAFDADKLAKGPKSWADFWDTKAFPGKRALRRGPRYSLEFALMADGVPAEQVYEVLSTPEGVDRAFAKLDKIKGDLVWWKSARSRSSSLPRERWSCRPSGMVASPASTAPRVATSASSGPVRFMRWTIGSSQRDAEQGSRVRLHPFCKCRGKPGQASRAYRLWGNQPRRQCTSRAPGPG